MELTYERNKVLQLEEEAEKTRAECDHLWKELQVEAKGSVNGQTTLAEHEQELDMARVEL